MALIDDVIAAIAGFRRIPIHKISGHSSLMNDLGIVGDDAVETFEMLEREFSVDFSDLDLSRYFHGEGIIAFGKKEELTVAQVTAMIAKKQSK